jgi:hypothetical protein
LPHEDQILTSADEIAGGQLLHLHPVDGLSVERR